MKLLEALDLIEHKYFVVYQKWISKISKVIHSVDVDHSGDLSFAEFLMLMVKTEGVEGVKVIFKNVLFQNKENSEYING